MTIEQKYLDFIDALHDIEKRICVFKDPDYIFERDILVAKELARIREEELSKIQVETFKLDESISKDYECIEIPEKKFRKRSDIPLKELKFYAMVAKKLNQSVIDNLVNSGFPYPDIGIRNDWIYVNFMETSFQITNTVKLYDFKTCEHVFYEIMKILIPELKRLKTIELLEDIIRRITEDLKKKIIQEETPHIMEECKKEYEDLLEQKDLEIRELVEKLETEEKTPKVAKVKSKKKISKKKKK